MSDDEFAGVAYFGAGLKLACPAPIGGRVVSLLIRRGGDEITYQASAGAPGLPWPPDPTWTEYGERCQCQTCEGRLVGATVEELREKIDDMDSDYTVNEDTFFLHYLESARDVVVRKHRPSATGFRGTSRPSPIRMCGQGGKWPCATTVHFNRLSKS